MIGFVSVVGVFLAFLAIAAVIGGHQNHTRPPDEEVDFRKPWHYDDWGRGSGCWEPVGVEVRRDFGRTQTYIRIRSKREHTDEIEIVKTVPIENFLEVSEDAPQN